MFGGFFKLTKGGWVKLLHLLDGNRAKIISQSLLFRNKIVREKFVECSEVNLFFLALLEEKVILDTPYWLGIFKIHLEYVSTLVVNNSTAVPWKLILFSFPGIFNAMYTT